MLYKVDPEPHKSILAVGGASLMLKVFFGTYNKVQFVYFLFLRGLVVEPPLQMYTEPKQLMCFFFVFLGGGSHVLFPGPS